MTSLPSYAATAPDEADVVEDVVQSLAAIPEAGPIEQATTFDQQADGSLLTESLTAELTVESGPSPTIELHSDSYEPLRIAGALPGDAIIADEGAAVFMSSEEYSVTPLPHEDGSVQVVTVLESAAAPERYDYDFSSTSKVTLEIQENGMVVIFDEDRNFLGGVASPWAFDADGSVVPTHFEVDGSTLTQVVNHQSGEFSYPISADPYAGQNLWGLHWIDYFEGQQRVNLRLSSWGRGNQLPWILIDHGWPEALNRSSLMRSVLTSKASMRQQYDCHAFGSAFAGDWNLEKFRPNRTEVWSFGVAIHRCNWTTPNGY